MAVFGAACWATQTVQAASGEATGQTNGAAHGLDPSVLVGIAVMLIVAKLGGELFERFSQPAVLGELVGGILIGNLALVGMTAIEPLKTNEIIGALAEFGVIVLLFEVGLESNLKEMLRVGWSSLFVAAAGITASLLLGWAVAAYFLPSLPRLAHVFIGATLSATSIGITARVLRDFGQLATREARIILGAAVIDDMLGLLLLAVMTGVISALGTGAPLSTFDIALIALKALVFLVGAIAVGRYVVPQLFRGVGRFEGRGVLLTVSLAFCLLLSWAAAKFGLAPIIGAFAAGLLLDEVHFELLPKHEKSDLQSLLSPVGTLVIPLFFVAVGLKVDLRTLAHVNLLGFALALTLAAIVGKQFCSLVVIERGINRPAIGLGMLPRGEVELIFAGVGATLTLPNANGMSEPVIGAATFSAVVVVVIITTLVTPPLLKLSFARTTPRREESRTDKAVEEINDETAEQTTH